MSLGIWNLQWLNHNSQRTYPILDSCSRLCADDSAIRLPDDFLLALSFAVHSGQHVNLSNFFIKTVVVVGGGCSIYLGYQREDGASEVAGVTHIVFTEGQDIVTAVITGVGNFDDTVGYIAVGVTSQFLKTAFGSFNFTIDSTQISLDCLRPMLRGVSSVSIKTAGAQSDRFYGDIVLRAGANIRLTAEKQVGIDTTVITITAYNQEYSETCNCTDSLDSPPVYTVNGVTADASGNIQITGVNCCNVGSRGSGVTITDVCAQPCCGCEELDALAAEVEKFANGKITLEAFLAELVSGFGALDSVVSSSLGS